MSRTGPPEVEGKKALAIELFGGLASSYEATLDLATLLQDRYWKSWVIKRLKPTPNQVCLDVGCGTLLLEGRLSGTGSRAVGVDLSEKMLRIGKAKKLRNVLLLANGDAEFLPFAADSFDAVVSCYVAKYVDLRRFVGEASRVVRPGSRIVLYDFVKPRGLFKIPLLLYLQGAFGLVGILLSMARRSEAITFRNLPSIVQRTGWDRHIVAEMKKAGVEVQEFSLLTGGVVAAYSGIKKQGTAADPASPYT